MIYNTHFLSLHSSHPYPLTISITLAWYFQNECIQNFCAASYTIMIAMKLLDTKLNNFEACLVTEGQKTVIEFQIIGCFCKIRFLNHNFFRFSAISISGERENKPRLQT